MAFNLWERDQDRCNPITIRTSKWSEVIWATDANTADHHLDRFGRSKDLRYEWAR